MAEHENLAVTCVARVARTVLVSSVALILATGGAGAADIAWKPSQLFERYSHDEDIRDILRNVLRQNGTDVVFTRGVGGTITHRFQRMPLQGAFNMIIGQNDLLYTYDADSNTVYVRAPGDKPAKRRPKRRRGPKRIKGFAAVQHADGQRIIATARRLRLGGSITMDPTGRTAIAKGTPSQVRALKKLIKRQEATARARKIRAAAKARKGAVTKAAGEKTRTKAAAKARKVAVAKAAKAKAAKAASNARNVAAAKAVREKARAAKAAAELAATRAAAAAELKSVKAAVAAKLRAVKAAAETKARAEAEARRAVQRKPPAPPAPAAPVTVARLAPSPAAPSPDEPDIDLSSIYRLSGVGKVGSGSRIAILNGKDYRVGEEMDGMEIIVIRDDLVRLAQRIESGVERFVVHFRNTVKADIPKLIPTGRPAVDLTTKYKLSGIGKIGGKQFAVLDGKDYGVGDSLNKMNIVRIAGDRVLLKVATDDGVESYVIKFRIRKKK